MTGPVGTGKTETVQNQVMVYVVMAYVVMAYILMANIIMAVSTGKTETVRNLTFCIGSFAGMSPDQRHQTVHEARKLFIIDYTHIRESIRLAYPSVLPMDGRR